MSKHSRLTLLSFALLFVMLLSLARPMAAYADDGAPPPPATEEPVVSDQSPEGSVQSSGEEAVSAESADTAPTEVVPTEEAVSLPEVLEQLPEDTAVVVVVEGEIEPLTTQDAAEAIVSGDPVWCPAALAAPTPGLNGCTASDSSLQSLLDTLAAAQPSEAGIIWIESSYDSSVNDPTSTGFTIDGATFTTMSNYALTIQGGWSGISGDASIGSASLFNGDYLHITNWQGNVTINNINILGTSDNGLVVTSIGDITLSNVTSTGNYHDGAYLDNSGGKGSITVDQSVFNDNSGSGLIAHSRGNIMLSSVTTNYNTFFGTFLDNCAWDHEVDKCTGNGYVSITNSRFDANTNNGQGAGLMIGTVGNVTLNNVSASENAAGDGADINVYSSTLNTFNSSLSSISIQNSTFNNNYSTWNGFGWGLFVQVLGDSGGDISLLNVDASNNSSNGYAGGISMGIGGNIFVDHSTFNNNEGVGLDMYAGGDIIMTDVTANGNDFDGAILHTANATIICSSQFENNEGYGIDGFDVRGVFRLNDVTFSGNGAGDYIGSPVITSGACPPPPSGGNDKGHHEHGQDAPLYILIKQPQNQLPGELGAENTFVSALKVVLTGRGARTPGLAIKLSFPIPESMKDANLAVLFWNGSEWVNMPGGSVVGDYFVITVSKPGIYVLVSQ